MELMIPLALTLPDISPALDALEEAVHVWGLAPYCASLALMWQTQAAVRPPVSRPDLCVFSSDARAGTRAQWKLGLARCACRGGTCAVRDAVNISNQIGHSARRDARGGALYAATTGVGGAVRYELAVPASGAGRRDAAWHAPHRRDDAADPHADPGSRARAQYDREAAVACQPPATAPLPARSPASVVVFLDGAWMHSWDNAHEMRIKVGGVHNGSERYGATRTRLTTRRYAATTTGAPPFGRHVTAAVE